MPARESDKGKRYGRLLVMEDGIIDGRAKCLCVCDCGERKEIARDSLRRGATTSCGCVHREAITRHGHASHLQQYAECNNRKHKRYRDWGGRGIRVCDRWSGLNGFKNFLADMGKRPSKRSLDRINNDGNYEPGNCRWATARQQVRNRRKRRQLAG
jgi:hypothetical protein